MAQHRRCEACVNKTTPGQSTHPYLKRRSSSYPAKPAPKSPNPIQTGTSDIDTSTNPPSSSSAITRVLSTDLQVGATSAPTSEDMGLDQRIEAANVRASELLAEAREQLTTPCSTAKELTVEEKAEEATTLDRTKEDEQIGRIIEDSERSNDEIFRDVVAVADSPVSREEGTDAEVESSLTERPPLALPMIKSPDVLEDQQNPTPGQSLPPVGGASKAPITRSTLPRGQQADSTLQGKRPYRSHDSTVLPQRQGKAINGSRPNASASKAKMAPVENGWHTLWSCNFEADW